MADLLVMNQDNGPDPWQYKLGMVVDVFPNGKLGPGPGHPKFWIVRLPNVTEAEARQLLEVQVSTLVLGSNGRPTAIGRRKDAFDTLKIPAAILNQLTANREITFTQTWTQVQAFITRHWPDQ